MLTRLKTVRMARPVDGQDLLPTSRDLGNHLQASEKTAPGLSYKLVKPMLMLGSPQYTVAISEEPASPASDVNIVRRDFALRRGA